ncbi:MAG TPA: polysaccharide deacetylase family protein [Bdellovibrionota bacterium]|nr:polysaccharide deacetylase family protein [Bdellovibrionota bacterium]
MRFQPYKFFRSLHTVLCHTWPVPSQASFALTFDDGPGHSTGPILDLLAEAEVRATFFVLGRNALEPAAWRLLVRAIREGHTVGNHSFSHKTRYESAREFIDEVHRCDKLIRKARREAGVDPEAAIPFRLPYGIQRSEKALDPRLAFLGTLGRTHVHWSSIPGDWLLSRKWEGKALALRMRDHVETMARNGLAAVFCLHDGVAETGKGAAKDRSPTVAAVSDLLKIAARRKWDSFTVPT